MNDERKFSKQDIVHISNEEQEKARDYWTKENMEQAEPLEIPSHFEPPVEGDSVDEEPEVIGAPKQCNMNEKPWIFGGRLFLRRGGRRTYCTAQFVEHQTILMSAAHCLVDARTGEQATSLLFAQAYEDGTHKGAYPIISVYYPPEYPSGEPKWDVDWAVLRTRSRSNYGNYFLEPDVQSGVDYTSFGYGVRYGEGNRAHYRTGRYGGRTRDGFKVINASLEHGSSGGAIIRGDINRYALTGINSFIFPNQRDDVHTPILTQRTVEAIERMSQD